MKASPFFAHNFEGLISKFILLSSTKIGIYPFEVTVIFQIVFFSDNHQSSFETLGQIILGYQYYI